MLGGKIFITKENQNLFPVMVGSVKFGSMKPLKPLTCYLFLFSYGYIRCVHICKCVNCSLCANVYSQKPRLLGVFRDGSRTIFFLGSPSLWSPELPGTTATASLHFPRPHLSV